MDISSSIRKLRTDADITQEQLGAIIGVSGMAVSQWENGRAVPRMGAIQRMSDYFGVPKSQIMGDQIEYAVVEVKQNSIAELVSIAEKLGDDARAQLLDFARYLSGRSR